MSAFLPELQIDGPMLMDTRSIEVLKVHAHTLEKGGEGADSLREASSKFNDRAMDGARRTVSGETGLPLYDVVNGVAVIHFTGIVAKRLSFFAFLFGGTASTEVLEQTLIAAKADASVKRALLIIDSPGGGVMGVAEAAATVRDFRASKPIDIFASDRMNSAAYWIGSQGTRVFSSPIATLASIGCYIVDTDISRMLANVGIEVKVYAAGDSKGAGTRGTQMTEAQKADLLGYLNGVRTFFAKDVGAGRDMTTEEVLKAADGGRSYLPDEAKRLGLIDGVTTLRELQGEVFAEEPPTPDVSISIDATPDEDPGNGPESRNETERARSATDTRDGAPAPKESKMTKEEIQALIHEDLAPVQADLTTTKAKLATVEADLVVAKAENERLKAQAEAIATKADATAKDVSESKAEKGLSKLLADARGENGGPVKLATKDEVTAGYLTTVYETKGPEAAQKLLEALPVIGKGKAMVSTSGAPGAGSATASVPSRGSFKGEDWRDPEADARLVAAAEVYASANKVTVSEAIVVLCA